VLRNCLRDFFFMDVLLWSGDSRDGWAWELPAPKANSEQAFSPQSLDIALGGQLVKRRLSVQY
jgi:hypothetical protein